METKRVVIEGLVVWVSIFHPVFEIDGRIYQSTKFAIYYDLCEPSDNYYGKLVCDETRGFPLYCNDMESAIATVSYQLIGFIDQVRK